MPTHKDQLTTYFARLDAADADGCADLFALDGVCIRQALGPDGSLRPGIDVMTGREAVRDYVKARGQRPYWHVISRTITDTNRISIEGVVRSAEQAATSLFLATAELDAEGRFARYLAIGTAISADDLKNL